MSSVGDLLSPSTDLEWLRRKGQICLSPLSSPPSPTRVPSCARRQRCEQQSEQQNFRKLTRHRPPPKQLEGRKDGRKEKTDSRREASLTPVSAITLALFDEQQKLATLCRRHQVRTLTNLTRTTHHFTVKFCSNNLNLQ